MDAYLPQYSNITFQDVRLADLDVQIATLPQGSSLTAAAGYDTPAGKVAPPSANTVVGRRPAFQDYRSAVGRSFGNFGVLGPLSNWTLPRFYSSALSLPSSKDGSGVDNKPLSMYGVRLQAIPGSLRTSTYVLPSDYNYLFYNTDNSAQNFRAYINWKINAVRSLGEPTYPSLG